jgi:flavin reductase (DIM6/NTAB) family NADH-FMN oxidoreductase RutF
MRYARRMSWFDQRPDDAMMGSFEAVGAEHIATVEPAQFREAMSQLGAAVHVVTTAGAAGTAGFTATAVCSVSDKPATLLVCVNRRSQATPILEVNRVLCVNTLRAGTDAIADVFAGRTRVTMAERFNSGTWGELSTGSPVLADAVVACDCRVIEIKSVATHNVVFAGVVALRLGRPGAALVYHERAYKQV